MIAAHNSASLEASALLYKRSRTSRSICKHGRYSERLGSDAGLLQSARILQPSSAADRESSTSMEARAAVLRSVAETLLPPLLPPPADEAAANPFFNPLTAALLSSGPPAETPARVGCRLCAQGSRCLSAFRLLLALQEVVPEAVAAPLCCCGLPRLRSTPFFRCLPAAATLLARC